MDALEYHGPASRAMSFSVFRTSGPHPVSITPVDVQVFTNRCPEELANVPIFPYRRLRQFDRFHHEMSETACLSP
jgi:hypothetical protein